MRGAVPHYEPLSPLGRRALVARCGIWGVVHNGAAIHAEAADALRLFRERGGSVILVSKASRLRTMVTSQLEELGMSSSAYDALITSGDVTRDYIAARPGCALLDVGPGNARLICQSLNVRFTSIQEADFAISSGAFDSADKTPEDLVPLLLDMRAKSIVLLCANPDVATKLGGRQVRCSGALAELYGELGGTVIYGGKPQAQIYEKALAVAAELRGTSVRRERVLTIGDSLRTDIAGAIANGFASLFVLGGIHAEELGVPPTSAALEQLYMRFSAFPTAVTDRLVW